MTQWLRTCFAALALLGLLCLLAFGVSPRAWRQVAEGVVAMRYGEVPRLSPVDLVRRRAELAPIIVLDVRTPEEFQVSHLQGALLFDPARPEQTLRGAAPNTQIVAYCSVGWRSAGAALTLRRAGYRHVWNLEGGIFAWVGAGHPVYDRNGEVRRVHPFNWLWGRLLPKELRAETGS